MKILRRVKIHNNGNTLSDIDVPNLRGGRRVCYHCTNMAPCAWKWYNPANSSLFARYHWSKVEELHQKKEKVMTSQVKPAQVSSADTSDSETDTQDFEEFLDWRSKRVRWSWKKNKREVNPFTANGANILDSAKGNFGMKELADSLSCLKTQTTHVTHCPNCPGR